MKILIIGAGWMGLHLAYKFQSKHNITIVERGDIFSGASGHNQFRFHRGYHYPRTSTTRNMILDSGLKFESDYGFCLSEIENAYYGLADDSDNLMDFGSYKKIFENDDRYSFVECEDDRFENLQGLIKTDEKLINTNKVIQFFKDNIENLNCNSIITKDDITRQKNLYDLVLDCTNSSFALDSTLSRIDARLLVYESSENLNFSLTVMDGPYFSIYPYRDNLFTVSDVVNSHTPMAISTQMELMENKIIRYHPRFKEIFTCVDSFSASKVQKKFLNSDRTFYANSEDNVISFNCCKIFSIYEAQAYLEKLL